MEPIILNDKQDDNINDTQKSSLSDIISDNKNKSLNARNYYEFDKKDDALTFLKEKKKCHYIFITK